MPPELVDALTNGSPVVVVAGFLWWSFSDRIKRLEKQIDHLRELISTLLTRD